MLAAKPKQPEITEMTSSNRRSIYDSLQVDTLAAAEARWLGERKLRYTLVGSGLKSCALP